MTAEVACRIISSGEENYVSSSQERIGAVFIHMIDIFDNICLILLLSTALIRRLKFRLQRSDRSTPQSSGVATSPSVHLRRPGTGPFNSTVADPTHIPSEGSCW